MYLIEHGDLQKFTSEEIGIIANIARYHRKSAPKLKHKPYAKLSPAARRIVCVGAALLRVADGLDRSHASVVRDIRIRVTDKEIRCIITPRWDAALEIWSAERKSGLLKSLMHRPIVVEPAGR
jgi:exopolyphosphatase/guanosine-5'-triphosphate,3'-diphosphate pyrophosphatase